MGYAIFCSMSTIELSTCFILLRKKFSRRQVCITTNIIKSSGVYSILMLNCGITAAAMTVNFIWVLTKLGKRIGNVRLPSASHADHELNKPILISLGLFICLYLPSVLSGFILYFYEVPHMLIIFDICMSLFYMTTFLSPIVYYVTLKDFKQGYEDILLCKTVKKTQNQQIELAVIEC